MGLFKSAPEEQQHSFVEPEFCDYMDEFAGKPVKITCDTNYLQCLPNMAQPYCIKIQTHALVNALLPGLLNSAEASRMESIRQILAEHLGGRCVGQGIVAEQSTAFLIYYVDEERAKYADKILSDTLIGTLRNAKYDMVYDPDGKEYLHYLYPSELQRKQMEDEKILGTLKNYGDDGSEIRKVSFNFIFPNRKAALGFFNHTAEKGFKYESLTSQPAPEGLVLPRYHLVLSKDMPFDIELLDLVNAYLLGHVDLFEGDYRGLETDVITPRYSELRKLK